ncbi:LysR family transcriptional regulator [Cytobacillus praedii]|uniref:LysR family transcriptional regulator n=1 Tax=Cytobacillus praedii TaxID=1742358 RepID=A0A4R1ANP2_9BACI|nr:LysR family transcriptional regulator [Cytobacillus praedii]TCJ00928.1 LysR family transcriptional regulator [Cytobacillus praedii]
MVMTTNNLKIFIKVADKMSITEAANDLYISQPAVSKAIKNIENDLNVKIFHRDKKTGLILTDVGKEVLLLARQMMNIENKIFQISNRENNLLGGGVKIGSFPAASTIFLSKAIALFKKKYPLVSIDLMEGSPNQINKWVEERVVDFGIVLSPIEGYEYKFLIQDKMVGILQDQHEVKNNIDLIAQQNNLILCKAGYEKVVSEIFKDNKINLNNSFIVQNADTLINMVKNGVGIGVMSEFILSSISHDFVICSIHPPIEMEIGLIAHSFKELTPAAAAFVNVIENNNIN